MTSMPPPPADDAIEHLWNAAHEFLKAVRQPDAKRRLKIWSIPLEFPELSGLPAIFFRVPGGIEGKQMGV